MLYLQQCEYTYSYKFIPIHPIVACIAMSAPLRAKDISLHWGRFCARSLATYIQRSSEHRSSWMFFIEVVHGRPGGRLQFSGGGSIMAQLACAFSSIRARCPKKVGRRDLMMDESGGWLVMRRISNSLINNNCCHYFYSKKYTFIAANQKH